MGFIIENNELKKYEGNEEVVIIPDEVTSIGVSPFVNLPNLKRIEFPDTILELRSNMIYKCDNLESVKLPQHIESIAAGAFSDCKGLKSIEIPEGVKYIRYIAFKGCESLESISLPSTIKSIDKEAFSYCPIRSVYIPNIDIWLKQITLWDNPLNRGTTNLYVNGVLFEELKIPEGTEHIGKNFAGCGSLKTVIFPETMKEVDSEAFEFCSNLRKIVFSSSISVLYHSAFSFCPNLKEVYFPNEESFKKLTRPMYNFFDYYQLPPVDVYINGKLLEKAIIEEGSETIRKDAYKNISSIISVSIPESVKTIESHAFSGCINLKMAEIPQNIVTIEREAFRGCKSLCITETPQGVASIGQGTFAECDGITKLKFSDKLEEIGEEAFFKCNGLTHLFIPSTIKSIGQSAFASCENLKEVTFEVLTEKIEKEAFADNPSLVLQLPKGTLKTKNKLPIGLCTANFDFNDEDLAYIILYQKLKTWKDWIGKQKPKNPDQLFDCMLEIYKEDKKAPAEELTAFALMHIGYMKKDRITELLKLMKERKYKGLQEFESTPEIRDLLADIKVEKNPIEDFVQEYMKNHTLEPDAEKAVKAGLPYAETGRNSSKEAIAIILTEYMHEMSEKMVVEQYSLNAGMLQDGTKICKRPNADQIGITINQEALSSFLESFVDKASYRSFLIAWARFATDESIERVTATYKSMIRGNAKDQYKAQNIREALLINDSQGAMRFFDRIDDLERYAQMRGMTAMEMRDSVMLPDFSFDADGIKRFDIGGNTIEVSITPDLGFRLYDVNAQKEIRSFPKKSNDPKKAEACAKEFAEFKKTVLDFAKSRTELIHKMHISGEYINPDLWHKVYVDHSVIRHLARLLVWEDEAKNTFMIDNGSIVDKQNNPYAPQGKIRVAHALDMKPEDVADWQQMLVKTGKKQLFEQIWEPVIPWDRDDIRERYKGMVLTYKERNELKKALKIRGIDAGSGDMSRDYHPRAGYTFSNEGNLLIGTCLQIDYTVDPDQEILTFKGSWLRNSNAAREMNGVLLEVDKAAVKSFIVKDNSNALTKGLLGNFTAAQIASFVSLAIESKATGCTAVLLDYKNAHFPEYADVNEFSLDW